MIRTSLVGSAVLGWSSLAAAQPGGEAPPPEGEAVAPESAPAEPSMPADVAPPAPMPMVMQPPPLESTGPKITVMWAPLRLIVPLVEFTAEYRVMNKLGVSVTLGAGKRTIASPTSSFREVSGTEIEFGAQVRYYAIGNFRHGMEVGVEALEEYVKFDEPLPAGIVVVVAGGLTIGPFLGYKIATGAGFTFEAQLGARYLVVEPAAQGSASDYAIEDKWQLPLALGPGLIRKQLLRLNVGWSF